MYSEICHIFVVSTENYFIGQFDDININDHLFTNKSTDMTNCKGYNIDFEILNSINMNICSQLCI